MLTLFDYLPSQNAYKVRQLLKHLKLPYRTELISIFEGAGQRAEYLEINPTGAVPAIKLEDGRVLAESSAILFYLAAGTPYLPNAPFDQAKVLQWLSFEGDYVQSSIGTLRHWTLTGKLARRPAALIEGKRAACLKTLRVLDRALANCNFLVGDRYSIADISVFAYVHLAADAGLNLPDYPHLQRWITRIRQLPDFLVEVHSYAIDPHSGNELP
jgi:glutathione S-transferase